MSRIVWLLTAWIYSCIYLNSNQTLQGPTQHISSMKYARFVSSRLTHWGRVTHICASNLTIIGSDNGLSPGRRQAIIWTNDGILLIGPLGTNFSEILIEILTFSFKKMRLKVSSGKWRPFCLGLNVLIPVGKVHLDYFNRCSIVESCLLYRQLSFDIIQYRSMNCNVDVHHMSDRAHHMWLKALNITGSPHAR